MTSKVDKLIPAVFESSPSVSSVLKGIPRISTGPSSLLFMIFFHMSIYYSKLFFYLSRLVFKIVSIGLSCNISMSRQFYFISIAKMLTK